MQHTLGPWRATPWGQTISIDSPDFLGIAFLNPKGNHNAGIPNPTAVANANLIAAAPDLYNALGSLLQFAEAALSGTIHDDNLQHYAQIARAAIAKAKGQA